jgi:23S rRNA pseudouridine2605 synthase
MPDTSIERLHVFLAHAGVASRRSAEQMIRQGRVTVNGRVVTQLGTKVDPAHDDVRVDGRRVRGMTKHVYILLNKPRGVLSAMEDPRGGKSLGDLISFSQRLYPVGRLDLMSEGLVLLTDDGELANLLTHPSYEHEKEYRVLVNGLPADETLGIWRRGVMLEGERTAPAKVDVIRKEKDSALLRVIMHEGRKRQIRSVAALLGHPVRELQRVRIGPLRLGTLQPGQWRHLTDQEVSELVALKKEGARPKSERGKPQAKSAAPKQKDQQRGREPNGVPPGHKADRARQRKPHATPRVREAEEKPQRRKPQDRPRGSVEDTPPRRTPRDRPRAKPRGKA